MSTKIFYTVWPFLLIVMALVCFAQGFSAGAWALGGFAFLVFAWIVAADLWNEATVNNYSKADLTKRRTEFGLMISTLSPDRYSALGLEFPELDIAFEGRPIVRLRNTNILLECFQKFLADSTDVNFASVNWYNDDKSLQERFNMSRDAVRAQWHLTVTYLAEAGHITKNSAAGNHSYVWMKGSRAKLTRWFGSVDAADYVETAEVAE